jgi:DNA adenine methylase
MTATRPVLRWLGGKWRLAPEIIALMPDHEIYVEPFGGAASVLLRKPRAYNEIYNDLDGELVNLFRVLRSDAAGALVKRVRLTPYSRAEYLASFEISADPVERAARLLIRSHMGHGTGGSRIDRQTGFRSDGQSASTNVAGEWADFPAALVQTIDRFRGVGIEQTSALQLLERYNVPKALIYLDPPYLPDTRSTKSKKAGERYHTYAFELSLADHQQLLDALRGSQAMILLSGYPSDFYDSALPGWERRDFAARAHRNSERTECVWINPPAAAQLANQQTTFDLEAA